MEKQEKGLSGCAYNLELSYWLLTAISPLTAIPTGSRKYLTTV